MRPYSAGGPADPLTVLALVRAGSRCGAVSRQSPARWPPATRTTTPDSHAKRRTGSGLGSTAAIRQTVPPPGNAGWRARHVRRVERSHCKTRPACRDGARHEVAHPKRSAPTPGPPGPGVALWASSEADRALRPGSIAWGRAGVIALPGGKHRIHACLDLGDQFEQLRRYVLAWRRQRVLDPERKNAQLMPGDEPVALQCLQGLGEDFLADAVDAAAKVVESDRSVLQRGEYQAAPASGHVLEHRTRGAGPGEDVEGRVVRPV